MWEAWFDGACEPRNPGGHATWGFWLEKVGDRGNTASGYGQEGYGPGMSNNVAEYCGAIKVMEWFLARGLEKEPIIVRGDNAMVVEQMNGRWKVRRAKPGKKPKLYLKYAERGKELVSKFTRIRFEWVPRERNGRADALSKRWLKEHDVALRWAAIGRSKGLEMARKAA